MRVLVGRKDVAASIWLPATWRRWHGRLRSLGGVGPRSGSRNLCRPRPGQRSGCRSGSTRSFHNSCSSSRAQLTRWRDNARRTRRSGGYRRGSMRSFRNSRRSGCAHQWRGNARGTKRSSSASSGGYRHGGTRRSSGVRPRGNDAPGTQRGAVGHERSSSCSCNPLLVHRLGVHPRSRDDDMGACS